MQATDLQRFLALFVDNEQLISNAPAARQYNTDQMRRLLDALGNPQDTFRSIHIAGTDGKGSIAAMLHHLLHRAGHTVGLYTSPHLHCVTERIRLGDEDISVDDFARLLERVVAVMGVDLHQSMAENRIVRTTDKPSVPPVQGYATVFEMLTAVAFCLFAERNVDIAIVEVGLGGRLDCTNVITPLVSVISSIDFDHVTRLGDSLTTIAREKLGIVKPGVPVVVGMQYHEDVHAFTRRMLASHDALLDFIQDEWTWDVTERSLVGYRVEARRYSDKSSRAFRLALVGEHQVANAVAALAALDLLPDELRANLDPFALSDLQWPGRFELLTPSDGLEPVVLDCAHTPQGAFALRQTLDQLLPGPRVFVLSQLQDKDAVRFAEHLIRPGDTAIVTTTGNPRSLTPAKLAQAVTHAFETSYPTGKATVLMATDAFSALRKARNAAPTATCVVTGSVYLVGEARRILQHDLLSDAS